MGQTTHSALDLESMADAAEASQIPPTGIAEAPAAETCNGCCDHCKPANEEVK